MTFYVINTNKGTMKKPKQRCLYFSTGVVFFSFVILCDNLSVAILPGLNDTNTFRKGTCSVTQFRCEDGSCIPIHWKCDAYTDCDDGSDEPPDCSQNYQCRSGQFQCPLTRKCIPQEWVCDGDPDCGISEKFGVDLGDEDSAKCDKGSLCPPNEARCGNMSECRPIRMFCDNRRDCPNGADEWDYCDDKAACSKKNCTVGCRSTSTGPQCFCADGQQPTESGKCVDLNECLIEGSCDQYCANTIGSYKCSCMPGYVAKEKNCEAINVPPSEPASLIFSTQADLRRVKLDGTPWNNASILHVLNTHALEISHRNKTVCYIHNNMTNADLTCANVNNLTERWTLPKPSLFSTLDSIHQIALDWVSENWYFLDDTREIIFLCNGTMKTCMIVLEVELSKPRGMALDPTTGFMFFTKWGHSPPMLERSNLDGSNRTILVKSKIVYPYGVTVDYPVQHIYWVDTYLDFVERVNYDGSNRRTVKKGFPVQNLYSISVLNNDLFVSSWRNESIIRLDKFKSNDKLMVGNITRPFSIHVFHRQRQPNVTHPCQNNNGNCEHICISSWKKSTTSLKSVGVAQCMCQPGYQLKSSGKCSPTKQSTFIIYGKGRPAMIKGISLNPKQKKADTQTSIMITDLKRPTALDYDVKTQYIYYSDVQRYIIERQKIDGTHREVVIDKTINSGEGLAIDWMGRNIYWTDEGLSQINVAKLSNVTHRKLLIQGNMFHPRAIVVDPKRGYMYWSDWASSANQSGKIERAWMDGTHRETFIDSELQWPNGLTIDYVGKKLYWCDAYLDKIERIGLDHRNRETIFSGRPLDHPYGLTYYDNSLYWTEIQNGTVQVLHLQTNKTEVLSIENAPLFEIRIFDNKTQTGSNECTENNNNCTELCLATPNAVVCACSDGFMLTEHNTCVPQTNYTVPSRCPPGYFQCRKNLRCINQRYMCDGDEDCGDGSDEETSAGGVCENVMCRPEQFRCDGTRCITKHWVCDGDYDCQDKSDEAPSLCRNATCSQHQFTCNVSGRCIPLTWTCDSDPDCGENDTSDEHENCTYLECSADEFSCDNKQCIPFEYYCDRDNDCRDGSDEKDCTITCDSNTQFQCSDGQCVQLYNKCDGIRDCIDGSDEKNCSTSTTKGFPPYDKHFSTVCEPHEFRCHDGQCIRKEFQCDGTFDCIDRSDEMQCTSINNATRPSPDKSNTKISVDCEHPKRLCDNGTKCISVNQLCDNHPDCKDLSDEGFRCVEQLCDLSIDCSHNCHNAPEGLVCYCPTHLHLQADGKTCLEAHPCDIWGTCSQKCTPKKNRHKCYCNEGYLLAEDGFTCKSLDGTTPLVIFSNRHELRSVDLTTFNVKALISTLKNTIALDFYHSGNVTMVFWTDVIDDKIYRGTLIKHTLSNIEVVVQTGLSTAEGLAVDWIGQNLYWVESNMDQIEVAKLNGSYRRTLVAGDIESPRAIALDPRDGYLFWTDWDASAPRIERCTMAGKNRVIVVEVDKRINGAWPNGLTLDYDSRRIYWIDARSDSIHTTRYDGSDHHEMMRGHETLSHPFAIALFENYVYWTDWRTNSVIRANKWNGSDVSVIQRTLTQPFDIQILHPSRQPRDVNPCGTNNGNCSHLCLLNGNHTYKCDCPHVMKLESDGKTCVVNERVLLFSRPSEIRGVDLDQPYYHTIPTISLPQVLSPSQLDFVAKTSTLYWTDPQVNEVKKSGLTSGPTQTIIDTGIENPTGLAIDWISNLMFVSSSATAFNQITVCNLAGEFSTVILSGDSLWKIKSLAVDPTRGQLYWSHTTANPNDTNVSGKHIIESASMDGSNRKILYETDVTQNMNGPQSLSIDLDDWRLYWVNLEMSAIQYYDFKMKIVFKVSFKEESTVQPVALVVYQKKLYYANQFDSAIHVADKTTGADDLVLRNGTGNILSLRIYDPKIQIGNNSCAHNKGGCEHLCIPLSSTEHVCRCATGYKTDPSDPMRCKGIEEFVFYSINWEIRGLALDGDNSTQVLGPISRVSMATSIDFHADEDYIYWADSDRGSITRIKRDGTKRQVVIEQYETMDNIPADWLTGLAIDWAAGNMYWSDPKRNVIEVAKLNGSSRYVVVSSGVEKATGICVDPQAGYLIWAGAGRIESARLDGSRRSLLVNLTRSITDITLDYEAKKIYWCSNHIERMNYDGSGREVLLNHSLENPFALTLVNDVLYWIDTTHEHGSIKSAPITNLSDFTILQKNAGDSLKDIQVFSKRKQMNTNACAKNNGGCEQLCLFNGTHPVCACPHGKVTSDGKRCEAYDSFIMYSRVVRIDSIHMYDETDLNPPYPSIQNKELIRNAIGLAYDYSRKKLFYSDIQKGSINSVYFNGTNNTVIVDKQGSVEGLAFEHVYNNLYWTCNNDATINRINLTEGNVRMEKSAVERVIRLGNNDKPRGIAVDSCEMRLYWTNWNSHQPSIQRAYVSSFQLESIITTDIRMPNALTLDRKARKLYWGDARLDKIERSDYDGSNRFVIAEVTPQHPFDIAIYGDFLFWTDWVLHAVIRIDKFSGEDMIWLRKDVPRPMGIVAIVKEESECAADPCLVVNGGCEDKCTTNAAGNISCKCFDDRELAEDGKRCITKKSNCTKSSFRCINGGCIPFILTCDGIKHCPDGSDENRNYCERRSCQANQFLCKNKRCITSNLVCNGADECGDYSDEIDCNCTDDWHFKCKDGNCIPSFLVCDGNSDCPDLSDEKNCTIPDCSKENQNMINCKNIPTTCIYKHWICDGDIDCLDGTDEENCTTTTTECPPDHFQCADGRCIMSSWQCDGENDCLDKDSMGVSSDEKNCEFLCRSDQFKCKIGECIPVSWQCDGMPDCQDGTDESEHCKHNQCESPWEFRCNSTGRCIPWAWVCDGESDCLDHADEQQCEVSTDMIGFVCLSSQFQCLNRQCISKQFYCDGDHDCDDNSDEPESCAGRSNHCLPSEFTCLNSHCIPETWKCNYVDDCGDNSDEDPEICAADETDCKSRNLFECTNGVCIAENLLCDGQDDCGDFSDENICNINECKDPKICGHHQCVDKPIGYECICKPGYKLSSEEANHCEDVNECEERLCSQLCYNEIGSYVCGCTTGYELRPDKHSCKAVSDIQALLIFSNRYYIRELDMLKTVTLLAHNLTNAVALDYNWKDQYIYWSDVTALGSSIKRMKLDKNVSLSNQTHEVLHAATLQNPDGLAVDWVGRNLYWCDKGLDTIEVSTEDGKYRKILISKGLEEPRAIALDPRHGYMYWSDWGSNAHIGKAGMDGSNSHVIISEMLGWPNSLTISYETNELFWADAREDYIAVSDLDGKNIKIIASRAIDPNIRLHHVFAIAIWEDYIYYTDWETKSVERCHKYNGTDCMTLATTIHRPMDLRVFHPLRQLPVDPNPCENSNCSTLCLLTPEKPYYRCACPENYVLDEDAVSCRPNCTSAHFVCVNTFKCIPFWWKCDTQDDCGDGSDEPDWCPKFSCMPGQFQCNNSNCIHPSQLCNGEDNCNDGSDERDCNEYTCLDTQFKCKGNDTVSDRCIFGMLRCDGKSDCPLGDDEKDCPPKTCPSNQYRCANGKCAPQVWVCDHDNDCGDNSDEQNCDNRTCTSDQFKCKTGRCIPQSWLCDGDPDCADGEDEDEKCLHPEFSVCNPTYFKCNNSKCIPGRWQCDYDNDCGDNSDEQNCKPRACSESEFRCVSDHKCIRGSHRCDGEYNCLDHSDELDCNTTCASDQFQCKNPNYCIFEAWRCDGDIDCADGSDEMNCTDTCSADKFKCNNGQCIFQSWSCDGENDCDDGSDEDTAMCTEHACEPGRYRCNNHKCIPSRLVCDNMNHCGDHSDETEYACKVVGRCTERLFKCDNGRCINKVLRCDGDDDCGDNSDEKDCQHSPCDWNTCSQICIENKHGNYTCKCAAGYKFLNTTQGHVCVAEDHPASLMVASEADLRFLSPYKADAEESSVPLDKTSMAPSFKLDSIDILWEDKGYTVFWSDRQDKKVQSLKLKGNHDTLSTNRGVREIEAIHTVLTGLSEPRGLAVDWVAKRLYIVDSGAPVPRILVSTLDGASNLTLINTSLVQPRDILVNPALGIMVWSDWGPDPQIEIADLDGSNRKVLVRDDLQWPTGLSMDYPASRLYWADPKEHVIESIGLDGKDRKIVKYFMGAEKPYKLDVFEDTLYVSTWHTNNIMRMDKFNRSSSNYLVQGLMKLSEIRIVQKNKQFNMSNPCIEHPCQETAMCLLSSKNLKRTCKCPEGLISGGDENEVQCTVPNSCSLHCHVGTCQLTPSGPKCVCPALFDGPRCQHYLCSNYCRNKGMCYIEYLSVNPSPDSPPPLKCNCHSQWTGERCEIPIHLCDDQCYNGGTCVSPRLGDLGCVCPPGFTGPKCEHCVNLICQNGGICSRDVRRNEYCKCQHGYTGSKCEISECHNYCKNNGTCNLTPYGPQCVCTSGFTGKKCEMDACRDHCQNGGTCQKSVKQITCECPPLYEGRRCEKDVCVTNPHRDGCADRTSPCPHLPCQNGGKCEIIRNDHICRCVDPYAGINCEMYVGHDSPCRNFCENGGICTVLSASSQPRCTCQPGWTGVHCTERRACADYCLHGGTCEEQDEETVCRCPPEYSGKRCEAKNVDITESQGSTADSDKSNGHVLLGIAIAFGVCIIIFAILAGTYYILRMRKSGKPFMHARLQDNVEISNPMYLNEDIDDEGDDPLERSFTLDSDKGGNFANPVYDSMYNSNDAGNSNEEKAVLLQTSDETVPPENTN